MEFIKTKLNGAYLLKHAPFTDERGHFARTFCVDEFKAYGLQTRIRQCNTSFNNKKGTLRGLHFQKSPYQEAKLIRCIKGSIFDVMVDIRPHSKTFRQWLGYELSDTNNNALFIPEGMAHGYLTLRDNTEVFYQVSEFYHPEASCEIRWDDPEIGIHWPMQPVVISEKDAQAPFSADFFTELKVIK